MALVRTNLEYVDLTTRWGLVEILNKADRTLFRRLVVTPQVIEAAHSGTTPQIITQSGLDPNDYIFQYSSRPLNPGQCTGDIGTPLTINQGRTIDGDNVVVDIREAQPFDWELRGGNNAVWLEEAIANTLIVGR